MSNAKHKGYYSIFSKGLFGKPPFFEYIKPNSYKKALNNLSSYKKYDLNWNSTSD